jgi:protocatechuate 3,4-dioxygenase beta subunit
MRLRLLIALLVVFPSCLLFGQASGNPSAQPPAQPSASPATGRITGMVFCNDTHRPARGAVVISLPIPKEGDPHPSSDDSGTRVSMDGAYTIDHLVPGDYTVIAVLPGYLTAFDDLPLDETLDNSSSAMRKRLIRNGVISVHNDATAHMDVTITRGATVTGNVLYSDGSPATQVVISVEDVNAKPVPQKGADTGSPQINTGAFLRGDIMHQTQATDDQGNFRIAGLRPGVYRIAAIQPVDNPLSGDDDGFFSGMVGDSRGLRIYSGDTVHKKAAKTYDLRAGDVATGIDITIPTDSLHRIQGYITTLEGLPVPVATLTLTDTSDDSFSVHTTPDRDGAFTFATIPAGSYKLSSSGAQIGDLPANLPASGAIQPGNLKNAHALADASTTILVKDDDLTDVSLQLTDPAQPASANQPAATQ